MDARAKSRKRWDAIKLGWGVNKAGKDHSLRADVLPGVWILRKAGPPVPVADLVEKMPLS